MAYSKTLGRHVRFFAWVLEKAEESMLKKSEVAEFRKLLLALQARLRGDVEQLKDEALDRREGHIDSKSPTHIAELGTQNYEQDFSLRAVEKDQSVLEEISAALRRIDEGIYGECEACREEGKPPSKSLIPKARLRAIPFARNCVACERKRENLIL
jgi:DnaK suppressor protein